MGSSWNGFGFFCLDNDKVRYHLKFLKEMQMDISQWWTFEILLRFDLFTIKSYLSLEVMVKCMSGIEQRHLLIPRSPNFPPRSNFFQFHAVF